MEIFFSYLHNSSQLHHAFLCVTVQSTKITVIPSTTYENKLTMPHHRLNGFVTFAVSSIVILLLVILALCVPGSLSDTTTATAQDHNDSLILQRRAGNREPSLSAWASLDPAAQTSVPTSSDFDGSGATLPVTTSTLQTAASTDLPARASEAAPEPSTTSSSDSSATAGDPDFVPDRANVTDFLNQENKTEGVHQIPGLAECQDRVLALENDIIACQNQTNDDTKQSIESGNRILQLENELTNATKERDASLREIEQLRNELALFQQGPSQMPQGNSTNCKATSGQASERLQKCLAEANVLRQEIQKHVKAHAATTIECDNIQKASEKHEADHWKNLQVCENKLLDQECPAKCLDRPPGWPRGVIQPPP